MGLNVINALQAKNGVKGSPLFGNNNTVGIYQPFQMLPQKEKTLDWIASTMDYIEYTGLRQLRRTAGSMMKHYKLANGQIEKGDYIRSETDYSELMDILVTEDISALELKFYPIIPTVVNVLTNEFAKRYSRITFELKDEKSSNEMLEQKYQDVEKILIQQASIKQQAKLQELGVDPNSDQGKQMLSQDTIKSLPDIQRFYSKDYKSIYQEWAEHQMAIDNDRFSIPELERQNFRNSLITDREFWHFVMKEDDYEIETWNPPQVFYRKSPSTRYISDAAWVGMVTLYTVPDVVDKFGWMMSQEQLESMNTISSLMGGNAYTATGGLGNEGGQYYDNTRSYEWNTTGPGVGMRQFMSAYNGSVEDGDIIRRVLNESEDINDLDRNQYIRVSTIYWKTQRKMGHLTKIDEIGNVIQDIVDETYVITDKPLYTTLVFKEKTKANLVFGEHIDWFWMNETFGGYKIGPNLPGYIGQNNPSGFSPMYIGMTGGVPGRIKYQFKGSKSTWGCKLPVEGRIYNDLNTKSKSVVADLGPYQVSYNMVLNQVSDIQIDELGSIIIFDQRSLPKHSMGEDWGDNNIQKAYLAAKNFSMIPIDTGIINTETALQQMPFQKIDMSQHERIMSKIKQAQWIKEEGLSSIGLNPQRMGTPIDREQTATGIEQATNASYAQTEHLFIQHSDELMPRVHQMRTDLAQFYSSTNPSIRLQYTMSNEEKQVFLLNGMKLQGRDFNVNCTTKIGMRNIMDNIKQMLLKENTSNVALWDKIDVIKADDMADVTNGVKLMRIRAEQSQKDQQQAEQQQQQAEQEHEMQLLQEKQQFEAQENQKNRDAELEQVKIKSAGYSGGVDLNHNNQDDYLDNLKFIQDQQEHTDKMNLERDKHLTGTRLKETDQQIQRQKILAENQRTNSDIQVAKINNKLKEKSKK